MVARGSQGVVYRAHQKSLNRTVALKMINVGSWATEVHVKRFRREAEAAASLEHPGIVPIYEVGERDGSCYFSMRFVEGGQLDQVIKQKPTSIRQAAELISKVARTIHYAHEHGPITGVHLSSLMRFNSRSQVLSSNSRPLFGAGRSFDSAAADSALIF